MATIKRVTKKKKKKKMAPIARLLVVIAFMISGYLIFLSVSEVAQTVKLSTQLSKVKQQYKELEEENEKLTDQKAKLQDPDYVESYARANYNLSKQGEQIFYLPQNDNK